MSQVIEPLLEQLVNERPLSTEQARDLKAALLAARDELAKKPASLLAETARTSPFAGPDDMQSMITSTRSRVGREPTIADVWSQVLDQVDKVLENAAKERRGVYFGNV